MKKDKPIPAKKVKAVSSASVENEKVVEYVFDDGKMVVPNGNWTYIIWYRNIISIEVEEERNNYIRFNCKNSTEIVLDGTLEKILEHLPYPKFYVPVSDLFFHSEKFPGEVGVIAPKIGFYAWLQRKIPHLTKKQGCFSLILEHY